MSQRMAETKGAPGAERNLANMEPEEFSSNQEGSHVWFAGEEKIALRWVGEIYNQYTIEVEGGGKK